MATEIGSAYFENKERIRKLIKEGTLKGVEIPSDQKNKDHACYFCLEKITDSGYLVQEQGKEKAANTETKYYIDHECYHAAKEGKEEPKDKKNPRYWN
jgi:hypothetical protein